MSASAAYFWTVQGSRIRPPRPPCLDPIPSGRDRRETEKGITWCVCKRVYIAITILSRTPITAAAEDLPAIQASAELLLRETILRAIIVCREGLLDKEGFLGTLPPTRNPDERHYLCLFYMIDREINSIIDVSIQWAV